MSYFHSLASRVLHNGSPKWIKESEGVVKEVPLFSILTRKLLLNFPLSSCQHLTTIAEKKLHVIDLSKSTFCKGLYGEN